MMRKISSILTCLLAGFSILHADVLVNTRVHDNKVLEVDETYTIDLGQHFQMYSDPGPVVTLDFSMPVQTGYQDLLYLTDNSFEPDMNPEGPTAELMAYELSGGGSYTHVFEDAARPENFVWMDYSVQFQLLGDQAPITVSNFVQYINAGSYDGSVVHRSDFGVVQSGRYGVAESDDYLLTEITKRGAIPFEQTIANAQGTLAMARGSSLDSASSEFYINLVDNSETFGSAYSVFGELVDFDTSMPVLEEMLDAYVWDLSNIYGSVFVTTPLWSPIDIWTVNAKQNFITFHDISVPEGSPSGITYSYEFTDQDGVEGTSEEEAANQDAFDISISNGEMSISRNDSGQVLLVVTGTSGEQERRFSFYLTGFTREALVAFPSSTIEQDGYLDNAWYGRFQADGTFPEILHDNHGQQWTYYGKEDGAVTYFYIYDAKLQSWIWTTPFRYPIMYVYEWDEWVRYAETTGNGSDVPRWFYNYSTGEWFTED